MQLAGILARIEQKLTERGLAAYRASKLAGKPGAIDNIRRAVARGENSGVTSKTLHALAPVLGTTAGWLMSERAKGARRRDPSQKRRA